MSYDSCICHCTMTNSSVNTAIAGHESVQLSDRRTISYSSTFIGRSLQSSNNPWSTLHLFMCLSRHLIVANSKILVAQHRCVINNRNLCSYESLELEKLSEFTTLDKILGENFKEKNLFGDLRG